MKRSALLLMMMLFPCVGLSSDSQNCFDDLQICSIDVKKYQNYYQDCVSALQDSSSGSQDCSNSLPYIGISSTAAYLTALYAVKWAWPNPDARAAAPYTYCAGKALLALGAVTSAVSTAFAIQEGVDAIDLKVDDQYISSAGTALPLGCVLGSFGDLLVARAAMTAHDSRIRSETEESLLTSILPKSWSKHDKKSLRQSEDIA